MTQANCMRNKNARDEAGGKTGPSFIKKLYPYYTKGVGIGKAISTIFFDLPHLIAMAIAKRKRRSNTELTQIGSDVDAELQRLTKGGPHVD